MSWSDRTRVKKGNIGEAIAQDYLESKGFIFYKPVTDAPHAFDSLAVKNKKVFVKTKAKMNKYNATGFDIKSYNEYQYASEALKIPVFVFFVDEMLGKVYGNWLTELSKPFSDDLEYPCTTVVPNIVLFSMKRMKDIGVLTEDQITELKSLSTRKYGYK